MASVLSNDQHADFLVGMAQQNPVGTLRFVKFAMWTGSISSAAVSAVTVFVLTFYWDCCTTCERPLGWWLLIHAALQTCMIAMRLCFLCTLRTAEGPGAHVDSYIESHIATPVWHFQKMMALATYAWMMLGAIWLVNSGVCSRECPALYRMTMVSILHTGFRVALVHKCFTASCAPSDEEPAPLTAALPEQILALRAIRFSSQTTTDPDHTSCAICFADYADAELLRQLPCGHHFHQKCADKWLERNKRCPLCMSPIDAVKYKPLCKCCSRRKQA